MNATTMTMRFVLGLLAAAALGLGCSVLEPSWEGSVGAVLRYNKDTRALRVDRVPPEGKAAAAGLKPGDQIVAVDGKTVDQMTLDEILTALRGPVGTTAKLTVIRDTKTLEITIERSPFAEGGSGTQPAPAPKKEGKKEGGDKDEK